MKKKTHDNISMRSRRIRKKFGGFSPWGTAKKAFNVMTHPEETFKEEVDFKIKEKIKTFALTKIDKDDPNREEEANELAKKMFAKNKHKINEGIDTLYNKMKSHGMLTLDELREAAINLIPIPEVPEVANDIVDVMVQAGLYTSEGLTTAELLNNVRQSATGLNSQLPTTTLDKDHPMLKGGKRNRRRITKKHLIIRRKARRKSRKSRRKSRKSRRKSRRR